MTPILSIKRVEQEIALQAILGARKAAKLRHVVVMQERLQASHEFDSALADLADKVERITVTGPFSPPVGGAVAINHLWDRASFYTDRFPGPWFWWLPSIYPVDPDWVEKLAAHEIATGRPFCPFDLTAISHFASPGIYPGRVKLGSYAKNLTRGESWVVIKKAFGPLVADCTPVINLFATHDGKRLGVH